MFSLTFGLVLFLSASASASENKTSSECWGCKPNTPHLLSCTGSSVIVIQGASYGYKGGCQKGITTGGGCSGAERNRCCEPGGPSTNCFISFVRKDIEKLERKCSSKSTCIFNSIRHDQSYTCNSFSTNSFTLINYSCQTSVTTTAHSSSAISVTATSQNTATTSSTEEFSSTNSVGATNQATTIARSSSAISVTATSQNTATTSPTEESSTTQSTGATNQEPESGSGGTAAGISIGVILAIGVAVAVVFFVIHRRRRNRKDDETKTLTASYRRKASNAGNTSSANHEADDTPTKFNGDLAKNVMPIGKKRELTAPSGHLDNYHHIDDIIISGRNRAVHQDDYHQVEDGGFIQNKPHDGYTHVGFTNTALGDDDYHHFVEDNSNKIVTSDDTYNHVTHAGKQLDKDDYHHIDVDTTNVTEDTDYNHIGPDSGTDTYGYNRFGVIKPEVNDNDNYNHIGNI